MDEHEAVVDVPSSVVSLSVVDESQSPAAPAADADADAVAAADADAVAAADADAIAVAAAAAGGGARRRTEEGRVGRGVMTRSAPAPAADGGRRVVAPSGRVAAVGPEG